MGYDLQTVALRVAKGKFMRKFVFILLASSCLCAMSFAQTQQSEQLSDPQPQQAPQPSLGDYARQLRLKKQQKEAQTPQVAAKPVQPIEMQASEATPQPKAAHIVTTDSTPERATLTTASVHEKGPAAAEPQPATADRNTQAENYKSEILAQKNALAALEDGIKKVSDSIHFAGDNCVANCTQWNEHQQQKQQEVETMKATLEEQKKVLEDMQEEARKAGFGSSVTEP